MKKRIILHVDVNNAFLSWTGIELLKNGYKKDIRKRCAIIAGDENQRRGIVLAKSTPCKKYNVITGEPIKSARKKCPYLEIYSPNYSVYKKYSNKMYEYLLTYSDKVERYSIDECFIDYTESILLFGNPVTTAYKIKEEIKNKFGFTVNVGIGTNKLTAKMASDFEKPDKVHTLFENEIETKMWPLPVSDLFMIGKQTAKKLEEKNIKTIYELAHINKEFLVKEFKKTALLMWNYANGIDTSPVESIHKEAKSISSSTVLPYNYGNIKEINQVLYQLTTEVGIKLRDKNKYATVVSIWIKYPNFNKVSKQVKLNTPINTDKDIYEHAKELFLKSWNNENIRAICVSVGNLVNNKKIQLTIFKQNEKKEKNIQETIDKINKKYGKNTITYAKK